MSHITCHMFTSYNFKETITGIEIHISDFFRLVCVHYSVNYYRLRSFIMSRLVTSNQIDMFVLK